MERLDNVTRSKIRSTQILTSLPQLVSELVQNSLDAEAKNIEVGMHCDEWTCWVRDDGTGINKEGLALFAQGIEGGRYSSSKSYEPASLEEINTFGFRGEALASAADLSCIEISSRTQRSKESWSVILKGGERLYYGPSLRWRRENAGTTISICDAFFNLPIRRRSHPNPAKAFDSIRRELETFALVFPHVAFTLRDLSKDGNGGIDKSRVMAIPRTGSSLATFRHMYGRALVENVDIIDVKYGPMKIEGFLSLIGSPSRSHQFLYLNRHTLDPCDLHRLLDKCFSNSTFSKHSLDESGDARTSVTRRSPRKGENRPVYVLNITVPPRDVDNCLEPAKAAVHLQNYNEVAAFLIDTIKSFLVEHGFKTVQSRNVSSDDARVANKRRKVAAEDSSFASREVVSRKQNPTVVGNDERGRNLCIRGPSIEHEDEEVTWIDPNTRRTYLIDPRTGNSRLQDQYHEDFDASRSWLRAGRRTIVDAQSLHTCKDSSHHTHEKVMPDWIKQALDSNDAFMNGEKAIPCLPSSKLGTDLNQHVPSTGQFNEVFSAPVQSIGGTGTIPNCTLSRESLRAIHVLGQVDRKFIACIVDAADRDDEAIECNDRSHRTVILVDQHAADERVRVERFLKALCLGYLDRDGIGVERRALDPPVPVLLTKFECDRLLGSDLIKKSFRDWGFDVVELRSADESRNKDENDEEGCGMVQFNSIPEVVADKLLGGSGSDLRELVKGYLARLEAGVNNLCIDGEKKMLSEEEVDEFVWLRALRHCPRELIDLVNSRACRGAIMFNDELSNEQCKRLLRQLSTTAFPFQCAHGRPSIVPLTTVGSRRRTGSTSRDVDWRKLAQA